MSKQQNIGKISFIVRSAAISFLSLMIFLPIYLSMDHMDKEVVEDITQLKTTVVPTDTIKEDTTKFVRIDNLPSNLNYKSCLLLKKYLTLLHGRNFRNNS